MTTRNVRLTRIARAHHSAFVERAMVTYRAFEVIDKRYPLPKFSEDNERWAHQVHAILADAVGNDEKIDRLLSLIGRITSK